MQELCGIDEAGRGCCAGDLVVAGCVFKEKKGIAGLNDSKKLTQKRREVLYETIVANSLYHIVVIPPQEIDEKGISLCMKEALLCIQTKLQASTYLFDGNTSFGVQNIETMIQADGKVAQVSAASILAKVTHDRNIIAASKEYPEYGFERHKGYATQFHIEQIKKHGYTPLHRKSYRIKALAPSLFDA